MKMNLIALESYVQQQGSQFVGVLRKITIENTGTKYYVQYHSDRDWIEHSAEDMRQVYVNAIDREFGEFAGSGGGGGSKP